MHKTCELSNCSNIRTAQAPGAQIGYVINNMTRAIFVCQECAFKIMAAPRGTYEITKHKELRILPDRRIIIT